MNAVQRGILMTLAGDLPPDIEPSPEQRMERLTAIEDAVRDFVTAEKDLLLAQDDAGKALRSPTGDHGRVSDAAMEAYGRKVEAQERLTELLGVVVYSSARRR